MELIETTLLFYVRCQHLPKFQTFSSYGNNYPQATHQRHMAIIKTPKVYMRSK